MAANLGLHTTSLYLRGIGIKTLNKDGIPLSKGKEIEISTSW